MKLNVREVVLAALLLLSGLALVFIVGQNSGRRGKLARIKAEQAAIAASVPAGGFTPLVETVGDVPIRFVTPVMTPVPTPKPVSNVAKWPKLAAAFHTDALVFSPVRTEVK